MRIPCPYCGPRDAAEFAYGGDASSARPDPETADPDAWYSHVYLRRNPMGAHVEYWHHAQGCRLWLKVRRDTVSHRIDGAEIVGPWAGVPIGGPDTA
ncbi:MAG: sarcosine oxidase subunit delta [Alphaproteobacteria bacterium]